MSTSLNLEASLKKLENIVETMEAGDLSLEQSLKNFEQGVKLIRQCQDALTKAEQKVQILMEENSELLLEEFITDEDNPE
ncbi:MAG: exodeoxyribonuclease VII small subunit [Legionellales bacterium]|nr:exodeoxyribonuclease VII small subunit [Legionellales bacterium]